MLILGQITNSELRSGSTPAFFTPTASALQAVGTGCWEGDGPSVGVTVPITPQLGWVVKFPGELKMLKHSCCGRDWVVWVGTRLKAPRAPQGETGLNPSSQMCSAPKEASFQRRVEHSPPACAPARSCCLQLNASPCELSGPGQSTKKVSKPGVAAHTYHLCTL